MESQSLNNPLSLFSSDKQKEINSDFSLEKVSKGVVLFEQEITKVEKFYILSKGLAKFYYGQNNRQILTGELKPGDGEIALFEGQDVKQPQAMKIYFQWGSTPHALTQAAIDAGLWVEGGYGPSSNNATRLYKVKDSGLWLFEEQKSFTGE